MANTYGTKYYQYIYVPQYNQDTNVNVDNTFIINLKKLNYSGASTQIKYYDQNALTISFDGQSKDQIDQPVYGSSASWNLYVDQSSTGITEIAESYYKQWQLEISGSTGFYWIGWVQQDNLTLSYLLPYNYVFNVVATDGLASLKNIDYTGHTSGTASVIQACKYALDSTGLNLKIVDQCNWTEHLLTGSTASPTLKNIYIHLERFKSTSNGQTTYTNCYDALSQLLEPYNCIITQHQGTWLIQQKNETNSPRHTYNSTLSTVTTANYNRVVNLTNNYFYRDNDQLSKIAPYNKLSTTFVNGQSTSKTNIISIQTGTTFHNGTSTAKWDTFSSGGTTVNAFASNPSTTKQFTTTFAVSASATGGTCQLVTTVSPSVAFLSGTAYPFFKFQLKYPNATVVDDSLGQRLTHTTGNTFTSGSFTLNQSGVYTVIYNVIPNSASYLSWSFFFNNFAINISAGSKATHDNLITTKNFATNNPISNPEETIYFSDSLNQNDLGAILAYNKTSGLTNTSLWSSYKTSIAKKAFDNYNFLSNTLSFIQLPDTYNGTPTDTGHTWGAYNKFNGYIQNINGGVGDYFTSIIGQSGFTSGLYSISVNIQNISTISSGINPNVELFAWFSSGGTVQRYTSSIYSLNSQSGYFSRLFIFNVPDDNAFIGFSCARFGVGSDLQIYINSITINSYQSGEYNQPHYNLYNISKVNKRYQFTDYVTLTTYLKPSQSIYFNSIIQINSTLYEVTGYSYDILNNKISLQLAEFLTTSLLPIKFSTTTATLNSINGN